MKTKRFLLMTVFMIINCFLTAFAAPVLDSAEDALEVTEEQGTATLSGNVFEATRSDFRDETIYSLMITRFYDGDTSNNVHCWDDSTAGNPDSDPAWRGDFKGLIEKLDYIKALGFTAVRLNPVAQNASGYDYHGEHPVDLKSIDVRYESDGYTYEDLINACHEKGLKVMQTVSLNSTSNFGEANLAPLFIVNKNADFSSIKEMLIPTQTLLDAYGFSTAEEYWAQTALKQYEQRLNLIKNTDYSDANRNTTGSYPATADYDIGKLSDSLIYNAKNYYHTGYFSNLNWDDWSCKYAQIAGDMVDLNTENYAVGLYLAETCKMYADYGVDAIYIKDARHITKLSLNENIIAPLKEMLAESGRKLEIFAEVVTRYSQVWYREHATESAPFYTWADDEEWTSKWKKSSDAEAVNDNMNLTFDYITALDDTSIQPTSENAVLNGLTYNAPDYSKSSDVHVFDFTMQYNFMSAAYALRTAESADKYYNDATWNIVGVETDDYSPNGETVKFNGGTQTWLENLALMFTFRGIPSVIQGTEIEFMSGSPINVGTVVPLSQTGRAYYGDNIAGSVAATDFAQYSAEGMVSETLNSPVAKYIRELNTLRRKVPALRKGQYTTSSNYVSGNMAFIRRYTSGDIDSLALVAISEGATFKNIPNGKYLEYIIYQGNSGLPYDTVTVTNGTLTTPTLTPGELAVYVCIAPGFTNPDDNVEYSESTASFDANGGTGEMQEVYSEYGYVTLPECTFTAPEGKVFKAWSLNGGEYKEKSRAFISEDVTFSAVWADIITVSFNANGGSGTMDSVSAAEGCYFVLPECTFTAPKGKSFSHWQLGESTYNERSSAKLSENTEFTAVWQDIVLELTSSTVKVFYAPENARLVLSSYTGNRLTDTKIISVSSGYHGTIDATGLDYKNSDTIKAFLLGGSWSMTPLCESRSVAVTTVPVSENMIYFKNTDNWGAVYAYYWSDSNTALTSWPGEKMTNVSGTDTWYIEVPEEAEKIIFNNGSTQTADLALPTAGSNLYTYSTGSWSVYGGDDTTGGDDSSDDTQIPASDTWYLEVPEEAEKIIFNDGSGIQTGDLVLPTDGSDLYIYSTDTWSVYGS